MSRGPGRPSGIRLILILGGLLILALGILYLLNQRASRQGARSGRRPPTRHAPPAPSVPAVRVAIVIDDVGFQEEPTLGFARLGLPMTFAVLPHQRYSASLARRLRSMGHEVILHLPMEPLGYPARDPGAGSVHEGMSATEIASVVGVDLLEVPGAIGLNNHMGSRATADPDLMRAVLQVCGERGLYFLDSRTTAETVAYRLALQLGVRAVRRDVFLDDRRERTYIEGQVRSLLAKARQEGSAVAIGHPDAITLDALRRSTDLLRGAGVRLVPVSALATGDEQGATR